MNTIRTCELPADALLMKYQLQEAYTDCYYIDVPHAVPFADFIEAFYTTPLFKVERSILALVAFKPSSDQQVRHLASGDSERFAAWTVEGRSANQLLLCDFLGSTRSWLMSVASGNDDNARTRLYFGSAVVPKSVDAVSGKKDFGLAFDLLFGFHKRYSEALLRAAVSRLQRSLRTTP